MSELYFNYGTGESFTSMKLANQKTGYTNPIRELLQNSLDASRDAKNDKCEINIHIETIKKSDIPNIDQYEEVLKKSIETLKNRQGYSANNKQVVEVIEKSLKQDKLKILMFVDNGTGMDQKKLENLLDEISSHSDESAGGSYGVGHISSYFLSSLRYVLYATKYDDDNKIKTLFTGSTILAGHESDDAQRGSKGRIVESIPKSQKNPKFNYPIEFPNFIKSKMKSLEKTGTMIAILGLNEDWNNNNNEAEYAIASNFFHSISHDGLNIKIHQENKKLIEITDNKVEELLASKKSGQHARNVILSGQATYQAYQAIIENDSQKTIELENGDKVCVFIKKVETDSTIALVRNGMLIARHDEMLSKHINNLKKNSDYESFIAVIDVDKDDSKELFRLIRNAENPAHDKLKDKKEANRDDIKKLKNLFEELSEKIKKHLTKIERDSFDLPFFEMPNNATIKGSSPKQSGQNTQAKNKKTSKKITRDRQQGNGGNGKNKSKPIINDRNLQAKNAVKYKDLGDKWKIIIRTTPNKIDNRDNVYLSICLGEDSDKNEANTFVDFISMTLNDTEVVIPEFEEVAQGEETKQIPASKKSVLLGKLNQSQQYNIIAEVKKPNKVGDMKVALLPIFGLKQQKINKE